MTVLVPSVLLRPAMTSEKGSAAFTKVQCRKLYFPFLSSICSVIPAVCVLPAAPLQNNSVLGHHQYSSHKGEMAEHRKTIYSPPSQTIHSLETGGLKKYTLTTMAL